MRIPLLAILLGVFGVALGQEGEAPPGKLGVRFEVIEQGALITEVRAGSAAEAAGLVPGSLLLSADGRPLEGDLGAMRARLAGAVGEPLLLEVRPPLEATSIEVELVRKADAGRAPRPSSERTAESRAFREAMRRGGGRRVRRATRELVAVHPDGVGLGDEVGGGLRVAWRRRPRLAWIAIEELMRAPLVDPLLADRIAEVQLAAGRERDALEVLEQAEALVLPDLAGVDGWTGDAGGRAGLRRERARALWSTGAPGRAFEEARALGAATDAQELWQDLGLAPLPPPRQWRGELTEPEPFALDLLDGGSFRSEDAAGEVVLLSFWASWCGPCEAELPELDELFEGRGGAARFLAVSTDRPEARAEVARMAQRLELDMPVAHAPELGRRFEIEALPTVVILGRDGLERHRARGYGPDSTAELAAALERVIAEPSGGGALLGQVHGPAELAQVLPLPGVQALGVGVDGPWVVDGEGRAFRLPAEAVAPEGWGAGEAPERPLVLAWAEGPVVGLRGGHWVRGLDALGLERWMHTLPEPLVDLEVWGDEVWLLTEARLVVVAADGRLRHHAPTELVDLAVGDEAVLGLDAAGVVRLELGAEGLQAERLAGLQGGEVLGADGAVGRHGVRQALPGRFGPDGAPRRLVLRGEGTVLGYGEAYSPVLRAELGEVAGILAWDLDGDARDELLVLVPGEGVLVATVAIP